jgi:ribonuclease HI
MSFYAVAKGKKIGIYKTWKECEVQIAGFKGSVYKKFDTKKEAQEFIQNYESDSNLKNDSESDKKSESIESEKNIDYYIYTDGACINNGKKNAKAGIGIYFGENDKRNVSKRVDGKQTNNTAELTAIIETYKIIKKDIELKKNIVIFTDSAYALKCLGSYGKKLDSKEWNDEIPNKELVKELYTSYKNVKNVEFRHIRAHTGKNDIHSIGNDNADKLATMSISQGNDGNYIKKEKIYLTVKYEDKEIIKTMGGKWDRNKKKWYIYKDNSNIKDILQLFK